MSGRAISGGFDNRPPAPRGIYAPRDSILLPSSRPILEPFEVCEPSIYKFKALERAFLFVTTAAAIVASVLLLFIET